MSGLPVLFEYGSGITEGVKEPYTLYDNWLVYLQIAPVVDDACDNCSKLHMNSYHLS